MPARVRVALIPEKPVPVSELTPDRLHGLFFSCAGDLADVLHRGSIKPFSLNFYAVVNGKRYMLLSEDPEGEAEKLFIEVSFLEETLFPRFLSSFILNRDTKLEMGGVRLRRVARPYVRDGDIASYTTLLEEAGYGDKICMDFLTPTTFKKGKNNYPLPDPKLVFKGLIKRWQIFSDVKIGMDLREFMEDIKVVGVRIETRKVDLSSMGWVAGFTGRVYLSLPSGDREAVRWFRALARFGEFAGVGRKTTMGFGKIKLRDRVLEDQAQVPSEQE